MMPWWLEATMKDHIAVMGDALMHWMVGVDAFPGAGEVALSSRMSWHAGGQGAVQALAAARLGARVALIGCVGTDAFGDLIRHELVHAGVETKTLSRTDQAGTGHSISCVNRANQVQSVLFEGANRHLSASWLETHHELISHCGFLLVNPTGPSEALQPAVALAKRTGAKVYCQPVPSWRIPQPLIKSLDCLLLDEDTLAILTNAPLSDFSHNSAAIKARELVAKGVTSVIVKLGPAGALLVKQDLEHLWRPPNGVSGDVTRAGDLFSAALLAGLARGKTELGAGKFAVAAACSQAWHPGNPPVYPSLAEIDHLLKPVPRGKHH
jgi:ribokinase